jgi:predicted permease
MCSCSRPISSYWNLANNARDCVNETPVLFSYAISTVLFDFFVWALPIPTIYHAKLPITQRLAIIALFSVALFVVVAAGIRIYYLDIVLRETYDVTWEGSHLWLWVAVEANLGIICGCVPWLKSLVKSWRRKRADSGLVSGGNSGSGNTRSGPRPAALQTIGSRGTVFRMDTLAKVSTGAREKAIYIDLESCYTPSEHGTREVAR